MKIRWFALLIAIVLASVLIAGCGDETATTTTAPPTTGASSTDTTASGETITLRYADLDPETGWSAVHCITPWLDNVEEATGGKVKWDRYLGQTLFKSMDSWEAIKQGIADLCRCYMGQWSGLTPLAEVIMLPFLPFETGEEASQVLWQLYEEFPALAEQFDDNHIVLLFCSSPTHILTRDKKIETVEDIKGLKIRAAAGPPSEVINAMGGTAVQMPMPDVYQSLQTGVLDGIFTDVQGMLTYRQYELGKYFLTMPVHVYYFSLAFNKDKWNSLPADIQTTLMSLGGMEGAKFWGANFFDSAVGEADAIIEKEGYKLEKVTLSDEEAAKWAEEYGRPEWEKWVARMESEGYTDARAILDRTLELGEGL